MPLGTPYVCGEAGAGSTDTLVIPISVDVPRSSQPLGATFVFVYYQLDNDSTSTIAGVSDDAPVDTDDGYSLCLFEDGLNHYDKDSGPVAGLIVNPLVDGVTNITLTFDSPTALIQAVAIAVTGIGAGWPGKPFDPSMTWWPAIFAGPARQPVGGSPVSISNGPQWNYDVADAVVMAAPTGATDGDWDWLTGELALYFVGQGAKASDPGGWTWADGALVPLANWHSPTGLGGGAAYVWEAVAYGLIVPTLAGPSFAGALDDASSLFGGGGNGFAMVSGLGPAPCEPGPAFGNPCFNRVIPI